jgi:hypothetical protein
VLIVVSGVAVICLLFIAYARQALSEGVNQDGGADVLQAWDMLHGNLLLHGWWLGDVSYWTTELPEYMIVDLIHGMNATTINLASAATYTLLVAAAALLAKGQATGTEGLTRALIAAGIMLAPWSPGLMLGAPNHVGTTLPLLVIFMAIDRLGDRWYLPWLVGIGLTWVLIADQIALYIAVIPLAIVSVIRLAQRQASWRTDAGLLMAAVLSQVAAQVVTIVINRAGGYYVYPDSVVFTTAAQLPSHLWLAVQATLAVFGADFIGMPAGFSMAVALLHLAGLILAAWAFCIGARRLLRPADRLVPLLVIGAAVLVVAFVLSNRAVNFGATHELVAVLPFGAVLAGRLLPGRRVTARLAPALLAALVAYAGVLGYSASRPAAPSDINALGSWLAARHLTSGIGDYAAANNTTVATGGRIQVRSVVLSCGRFTPYPWETKKPWYEPPNTASFLVLVPPGGSFNGTAGAATAQFGAPDRTARVGPYEVLVWHHNLLPAINSGFPPGCATSWPR